MLEYFAYKKFKKNKPEKDDKSKGKQPEEVPLPPTPTVATPGTPTVTSPAIEPPANASPILNDDDERFLERLTSFFTHEHAAPSSDTEEKPALPPRVLTPDVSQIWDTDSESFRREDPPSAPATATATVTKENLEPVTTTTKKHNRFSTLLRRGTKKSKTSDTLTVPAPATDERDDLTRVLDDLNLLATPTNKALSLSPASAEVLQKFTLVLKDLVNGVPTAVHDLTSLLDDKDGTLSESFEKLPSSLQKLVTQLPEKLTSTIAPELLAAAAEAQGLSPAEAGAAAGAGSAGLKGAAKKLLNPKNIKDLVTKPGAIVSMLRGIMNALKLRWPAFMGTNVIWSLALFLLLFVLWYCHKRGREVRLEREKSESGMAPVPDGERVEELGEVKTLPAPETPAK